VGVFEDPALLEGEVPEEWLRQLIASTAQVLTDETEDGLRGAFSRGALERYARNTLSVLSRYPEVLAKDSAIVQGLLKDVLGKMAAVETFGVMPLADIAVEGALAAFADNPELVDTRYAEVLGQLAGELAKQVAQNGLSGLQAEDLLESVSVTIATNDELFVQARSGLADAIVGAVLKAANADERGLLAGSALVAAIQGSLDVVAGFGLGLPASMDQVRERVQDVVAEALVLAADRLGKGLAQSDLPDLVVELVAQLARGELPAIGSDEFAAVFDGFLN
jgi:hypothetical protein